MTATDPLVHEIPMRWADLDQLNHVNNVVYLDYAAEARAVLADAGIIDGHADVTAVTVRFLRPMLLGRAPVVVTSSIDGATLTQRIGVESSGSAPVFAEVTTQLGPREPRAAHEGLPSVPTHVRRSDLDASGAVTPTKVFELFQESRVLHVSTHIASLVPGSFVVGTSTVTFHEPIAWRAEPYATNVWVSRVGRASFEFRAELSDAGSVLADSTTILVGFDPQAQTSRPFGEQERAELLGLLRD